MLIDALTLSDDSLIVCDICIVGAGAAGITLAREFINQPEQVCLLESGGFEHEETTQDLYAGKNIGDAYFPLKETRSRSLGGSTNLWGGWSRPLDDIDFQDRPWMNYSSWPITKTELIPYYERAQEVSGLGSFAYNFSYWKDALLILGCHCPNFKEDIETNIWQIIPPNRLRFGEVYRNELEQAKNVTTYLHANVLEIETNDSAREVQQLRIGCLNGKKFTVQAKVFILAVGGIENPRLLLASNQVQKNGLGNQHDLVGRFFMEHPYLNSGKIYFAQPPILYTQQNIQIGKTFLATALGLSEKRQESEQVLNFSTRLLSVLPDWVEAINSLKYKLQRKHEAIHQAFPSITEICRYKSNTSVLEDLKTIITNLDQVSARAYHKLFNKSFYSGQSNFYETHLIAEQEPNPDSRITLSSERDQLGMNRTQLDWRLSSLDKYTIKRSQQILADELARSGLGQLEIEESDEIWSKVQGSYHHMGTTRMSLNPKQGVVDENCLVHGISNLYVAGSSVFPTSGLSNPTLTIVALAIRLADHLKTKATQPINLTEQRLLKI
ncbi:GMC oxidoreductase [Chroococcus sp. FPU101]|uniref:GMC oxidoreductase n=1 Tax=Chroococcus sp. FPU101 TaxID=1974212 RepID=UPI001A8CAC79|nr:GMC family oxidoreductase [Chroococcus sp. FPU101]GFE69591.1 GMC oxidoreductase [Chroococcus sp. FPU101]